MPTPPTSPTPRAASENPAPADAATAPATGPRILVQVVAYNAATTLTQVLDRIPESIRAQLTEICVFDDASKDDTR